ncbi:MAG TPA: PIG-L deacetylase family protein [Chloroflexota bacterium]
MQEQLGPVLVIVAHPDDAEFGCGGSVGLWTRQGRDVIYLLCTRGDKGSADPTMTSERLAAVREQEQRNAARVLGVKEVHFLDMRDGEVQNTLAFREQLVRAIRRFRPYTVVTHDPTVLIVGDEWFDHPDHRAVGLTTADAIYPTARDHLYFPEHRAMGLEPHKVREVLFFGSQQPNHWLDISETIDLKLQALREHYSQFENFDQVAEWVRTRAQASGESQGMAYAEAYRRVLMRS